MSQVDSCTGMRMTGTTQIPWESCWDGKMLLDCHGDGKKAEMNMHFTIMLLLLCIQWQQGTNQLLSNSIPTTM